MTAVRHASGWRDDLHVVRLVVGMPIGCPIREIRVIGGKKFSISVIVPEETTSTDCTDFLQPNSLPEICENWGRGNLWISPFKKETLTADYSD